MSIICKSLRLAVATEAISGVPRSPLKHARSTRSNALSHSGTYRSFHSTAFAMQAKDWSATQYLKFEAERTRPSQDLLSQVPLASPERVVDLGCGPGNSTAVLRKQFPHAHIVGLDSSPDMIEKAKTRLPEVDFVLGDLSSFQQPEPVDLLFSNAVFQWVPYESRVQIFTDLITAQNPGGVFAFQVPDNFSEPSHAAMRLVANEGPWAEKLKASLPFRRPFQSPAELYDHLKPLCSHINIWHTHYYHILDDHQAVVEWVKGTGLRPYLDALSPPERDDFLRAYLERVKKDYPLLHDGKVCLRYPRLFLVAVRA